MLPDPCTVYIDLETRAARVAPPHMKGYPAPVAPLDEWDDASEPPRVREPGEIKLGTRKDPAKIKAYIDEQLEKDRRAAAEYELSREVRHKAAVTARDEAVEALRRTTSLTPFYGGQISMIGIAVENHDVRLIHPGNDPQATEERLAAFLRPTADDVRQRLALFRHGEFRCLQRLAVALKAIARLDMPENRPRRLVIKAWSGFSFDFEYVAKRAAALALFDPDTNAFGKSERDDGLDEDLRWLARRFWHDVPWRARGLADPRRIWQAGDGSRPGKLLDVAAYYGRDTPNWIKAFDHQAIPDLMAKPGHPYDRADRAAVRQAIGRDATNLEVVEVVCADDVDALRFIDRHHQALGLEVFE